MRTRNYNSRRFARRMLLRGGRMKEKFECGDCGCYFWVENRNDFGCPNCFQRIISGEAEQ